MRNDFEKAYIWPTPTAPIDATADLDGVAKPAVTLDDLNPLTSRFVELMLASMTGSTNKATMFKKILEAIHESYKKETPENQKIHKRRQKFVVATNDPNSSITVFDVDTTIVDFAVVIYGYSTKPGMANLMVYDDTQGIAIQNKIDGRQNEKLRRIPINTVDTYIVPYESITFITYPSAPSSVLEEYETTIGTEIRDEEMVYAKFLKIENDIKQILSKKDLQQFITYFSRVWKEDLRDVDTRYNTSAMNKRADIWKLYYEIMNTFITQSPKEIQEKFFTPETIVKIKESLYKIYETP